MRGAMFVFVFDNTTRYPAASDIEQQGLPFDSMGLTPQRVRGISLWSNSRCRSVRRLMVTALLDAAQGDSIHKPLLSVDMIKNSATG